MEPVTPLDQARAWGHEQVLLIQDVEAGLTAVIALHDTTLGPAVGGTRMFPYPTLEAAWMDALRLSRAMTAKAVMAGVNRGGGKAVIVGDPAHDKTRALLGAYAKAVDRLGGRFHTGCDMGIEARDIAVMSRLTKYVSHTPPGSAVDTADLAALGVFAAIRAAARTLGADLQGLSVAVQGLGQVGSRVARRLHEAGAVLTVCDVDEGRADRARTELGATVVAPGEIYDVDAAIFSPNAAGGVVNDKTLPRLRCRAVVGGANEQLAAPGHGDALFEKGILYGPDYVVNAGGLLSLLFEEGEEDLDGIQDRVREIGPRTARLWKDAQEQGIPPHRLADREVETALVTARHARRAARLRS